MKIVSSTVYALRIPFVESFRHSLAARHASDSVVVKLVTDTGIVGFGEGVPRAYVTGETPATCLAHIVRVLLPAILDMRLVDLDSGDLPTSVDRLLPRPSAPDGVHWHAARCAVELAMLDCILHARGESLAAALPPRLPAVTYSGVISAGSPEEVERRAQRIKAAGLRHVKLKVAVPADADMVRRVRDILGPSVSLRLDANGAFSPDTAIRFLAAIAPCAIAAIEQPIPRGDPQTMAALRIATPIPLMADESLVTRQDAADLIAHQACDLFNLRLSKCGGLANTLAVAAMARQANVGLQLGCQVGETALLSAAGRHLAAHLADLRFVEGSYGAYLLTEDIVREDIRFGPGGLAPLLHHPGLGVTVREDLLAQYAAQTLSLAGGVPP